MFQNRDCTLSDCPIYATRFLSATGALYIMQLILQICLHICILFRLEAWKMLQYCRSAFGCKGTYVQDKLEEGNDAMFLLGNIMIMLIMGRRDVIPSFFPLPSFIFSRAGSLERFCKKPRAD